MSLQESLWHEASPQTDLFSSTFVVVDLETTGGKPSDAHITEIGAVKVSGGEIIGTFATLVNPEVTIPAYITILTGIADIDVIRAPTVQSAVTEFIAWAGWNDVQDPKSAPIFVAHNAPYDFGFIKGALAKHDISWHRPRVLDTADLARRILARDEVPNRKLATLARHFHAQTTPTHRAFDDAKATVDVLHGLIARLGNLGINTYEELKVFRNREVEKRSRKRAIADDLPNRPGVYIFEDESGRALYVGKSKNIKSRVTSYFTGAETRNRMNHMITLAARVRPIICATELEATVRELRLIHSLKPTFNVVAKRTQSRTWLSLSQEHTPRLKIRRGTYFSDCYQLGPLSNATAANEIASTIYEITNLRQCTKPIGPKTTFAACALYELQKCSAPCLGSTATHPHAQSANQVGEIFIGVDAQWHQTIDAAMSRASEQQNYELAATWRDRKQQLRQAIHGQAVRRSLTQIAEIVAAKQTPQGGWELHLIRHGQLAGAMVSSGVSDPKPSVIALKATAATYDVENFLPNEARAIYNWLASARLVEISSPWSLPMGAKPAISYGIVN